MKTMPFRTAGLLMAMFAWAQLALGQQDAEPGSEPYSEEAIDEVTVYGQKSMIQLRSEFEMAQANMFVVFNALNSNDEFDVECEYEQRLGSRRWYQVCTPKFVTRQPAHEGSVFLRRNKQTGEVQAVTHHNLQMNESLWTEMAALISKNPELRKAYRELEEAKNAVDAELSRRQNN